MPPSQNIEVAKAAVETTSAGIAPMQYAWVAFISLLGGAASFIQKARSGKVRMFNLLELVGELVVAGFVGVVTFWIFREYAPEGSPEISYAATGIASHMGTRALFVAEQWLERKFAGFQ